MFVIGTVGDDVNEYELSVPFDASTRIFIGNTSISEQENLPQGIAFSNDGTRMFVIGDTGNDVNEYELSVPLCCLHPILRQRHQHPSTGFPPDRHGILKRRHQDVRDRQ